MPSTGSERVRELSPAQADRMPLLPAVLRRVESAPDASRAFNRAADLFVAEFERDLTRHPYFLTVVMRTQGRRPEPMRDALLCLAGQSVEDFEVLIMCHNIKAEDLAEVEEIVAAQPESFRRRVSLHSVEGGRRARPLNEGVDRAQGRYVSFFDDDDLLLGNWVEAFAEAAAHEPSKLVRAVVAHQNASREVWPQDQQGFRHTTWPIAYPAHFDQLAHLQMNHSPFMGWAFPRQLFSVLGLRFDEELYVCEDWDMILRGSLLLGVVQAPHLTAIYRRWVGIDSSYTAHDTTQWQASQLRVIAKLDEYATLMPSGSIANLRTLMDDRDELGRVRGELHAVLSSRGYRYGAPVRFAMRVADFGVRKARGALRRIRSITGGRRR